MLLPSADPTPRPPATSTSDSATKEASREPSRRVAAIPASDDVHCGQRVALSGIEEAQNGHSLLFTGAGAGRLTRFACLIRMKTASATMMKKPAMVSSVPGLVKSPSVTSVASLLTTMPDDCSAMMPRNIPIPAATPLRIDTGIGRGHHHHVKTAGAQSKFGIAPDELDEVGGSG